INVHVSVSAAPNPDGSITPNGSTCYTAWLQNSFILVAPYAAIGEWQFSVGDLSKRLINYADFRYGFPPQNDLFILNNPNVSMRHTPGNLQLVSQSAAAGCPAYDSQHPTQDYRAGQFAGPYSTLTGLYPNDGFTLCNYYTGGVFGLVKSDGSRGVLAQVP